MAFKLLIALVVIGLLYAVIAYVFKFIMQILNVADEESERW